MLIYSVEYPGWPGKCIIYYSLQKHDSWNLVNSFRGSSIRAFQTPVSYRVPLKFPGTTQRLHQGAANSSSSLQIGPGHPRPTDKAPRCLPTRRFINHAPVAGRAGRKWRVNAEWRIEDSCRVPEMRLSHRG